MSDLNKRELAANADGKSTAEPTRRDPGLVEEPPTFSGNFLAEASPPLPSNAETATSSNPLLIASESESQASADSNTAEELDDSPESETDAEQRRQAADAQVLSVSRQHTRRAFVGAAAAVAAGFGFYRYLNHAPTENMQPLPLEDAYKFNAAVSQTVFGNNPLAPTYPLSRAETLRINGIYGLKKDLIPETWRLQLVGMKNAAKHPRFVPDVTAWEYQYMAPPAYEDKGHDTKVDPNKEAAGGRAEISGPLSASSQAPHNASSDSQSSDDPGVPRETAQSASEKHDPKMMSSTKMAPASVLQREMTRESDDGESNEEDDNHTGRKPRGMEEAGESDSTLPPHTPGLLLQLTDITRLPRVELVTQFKCIEGWSQIVHWAGVRMADFLELYPPQLIDGKEPRYVYMETPDGDYYNGYDLEALRHPQALLVTEMMGASLTQNHGAPLRLHLPTKYGYKQIKRIGLIAYTNNKPDDYWTKLGYDWYGGI